MKKVCRRREHGWRRAVEIVLVAAVAVAVVATLGGCDEASAAGGTADDTNPSLPGGGGGGGTATGDLSSFALLFDGGYASEGYRTELVGVDGNFPLEEFLQGAAEGSSTAGAYLEFDFYDDTHDFAIDPGTYTIVGADDGRAPGTVTYVHYMEDLAVNWDTGQVSVALVASNEPDPDDPDEIPVTGGSVTVSVSDGVYSFTYVLETPGETIEGAFTGTPTVDWDYHRVNLSNELGSGWFKLADVRGTRSGQALTSYWTSGSHPFPVPWYAAFYYMAEPAPLVLDSPSVNDTWSGEVEDGWIGTTTVVDTDYTASGYVEEGVPIEGCLVLVTEITGTGVDDDTDQPASAAQNEFVRGTRTMVFAPGIGVIGVDYEHEDGSRTVIRLADYEVATSPDYVPMAAGNTWTYYWYNDNETYGRTVENFVTETWTMQW
jgi:hypothetical protein